MHTVEALLCIYCMYESHLNHIHLSACWSSLGHLAKQSANKYWLHNYAEALEPLAKHTTQTVDARKMHSRELANIAYGAARSMKGKHDNMGALFMALGRAAVAEQRMRDFIS